MAPFPPEREEDFAPLLPEEVARRGLAYAREGRVRRVFRVGERLLGEVQGSEPTPYRVEVGPGLVGRCTCPYPFFPCKHAAALLYAYLERRPEDLWPRLKALPPEEAKGLLLRLSALPEVAFLLKELLFPEEAFAEGVRRLRQAFRLGGGEEEAKALLLRLPQAGKEEVAALLRALLEAPFDPGPYLGPVLRRHLELGGDLPFLLGLYLRHPFEALGEAFLELALKAPEKALALLAGREPLKRALKAELLFRLGREEEALGVLREGLEGVEDYLAFVERLLRLGRREEALRYAEEAVAWFGKDPRLLPLLDLLAAHRGLPEDHLARFRLRPSLEDYLALKAKLGRAFAEERPRLLRQVQDPALLAKIHLLEEDWKALDRLLKRASPEAYPALAAVLEERLPEEAARLYLEAARARVESGGRAAYREAAGLLGRLARLDPRRAEEVARALARAYPRRKALLEELSPFLEGPRQPHP
ncbi:SWIM zinc finger [Thermus arciformis]|uniref:SWIM zinc finger n=1 Tax=Thermus arciformis TaxID=482827 RepID=A0A1G7DBF8_9DEIN|nr:SWIM zinc finger family protein [Thermus arciformis]SDE48833.1 SWIM zinc finger [Thermus arciformis]